MDFYDIGFALYVLICIYLVSTGVQLCYYLFVYLKIFKLTKAKPAKGLEWEYAISVIISAKDEASHLMNFLPCILQQDYPVFEVIVVNDRSTDDTAEVLQTFANKDQRIKIVTVSQKIGVFHGKKHALSKGIKKAENEWLVFTDADCYPLTDKWLKTISENFGKQTDIILGYGGYERMKSAFLLNKLIRYETAFIALQYSTFAASGFAYMGVGRNLSYRKSIFYKNNGFAAHQHVLSGDDDLFVSAAANKNKIRTELNCNSFTRSVPKTQYKQWIQQKRRHISTSRYYRYQTKILLAGENVSRILFYGIFLAFNGIFLYSFLPNAFLIVIISVFCVRLIIQTIVFRKTFKVLKETDLLPYGAIFDLILPVFYFIVLVLNIIKPSRIKWK